MASKCVEAYSNYYLTAKVIPTYARLSHRLDLIAFVHKKHMIL